MPTQRLLPCPGSKNLYTYSSRVMQATNQNRRRFILAALAAAMAIPGQVRADTYPSRPIKIVVPWPAGGIVDARVRLIADRLHRALKQQVVVENKPGASGTIGAQTVARSAPDGYTLLAGSYVDQSAALGLFRQLPYEPERDFAAIASLGTTCLVLVANRSLNVSSLDEFVTVARSKPGKLSYASAGPATPQHLLMEQLKRAAGIDLEHIPYKGGPPALQDVVAGHVPAMFESVSSALPYIQSGKLLPLMTDCHERLELLPDVPSSKETGMPEMDVRSWGGLFAPAGTPDHIIWRLNDEINKILSVPDVHTHVAMSGAEYPLWSAEEFAAFIKRDRPRWMSILRMAGIEPQ